MHRIVAYAKLRADRWFIVAMLLLAALPVGALIGAIADTIQQIRSGH